MIVLQGIRTRVGVSCDLKETIDHVGTRRVVGGCLCATNRERGLVDASHRKRGTLILRDRGSKRMRKEPLKEAWATRLLCKSAGNTPIALMDWRNVGDRDYSDFQKRD